MHAPCMHKMKVHQNTPFLCKKIQKFSGEWARPPPQTHPPAGGGHASNSLAPALHDLDLLRWSRHVIGLVCTGLAIYGLLSIGGHWSWSVESHAWYNNKIRIP